jgi:hypothetical protein
MAILGVRTAMSARAKVSTGGQLSRDSYENLMHGADHQPNCRSDNEFYRLEGHIFMATYSRVFWSI